MNPLIKEYSRLISRQQELTQGVVLREAKPKGGPGGGNGSLTPVVVYDDLPAGTFDTAGKFTPGADVRCLPVIDDAPDTDAAFIIAKWRSASALALGESGCCGGEGGGAVPSGVRISQGLGADGNDRVYDADANSGAVVIAGTGVAPDAVLSGSITDGTNTITLDIANNNDGTFTADSESLTTLNRGVVRVTVTDGATTDVRVITYAKDDDATERGFFTGRPPAPDMTAATDLGASNTDNRTSDRTPTFSCAHGGTSPIDTGGPIPRLYIKGVLVASGSLSSYTTTPPVVSSVDLTPSADLDFGYQNAQLVLEWRDGVPTSFWGPPSLSLRINIDEDATEETEPDPRYCRLGWLTTIDGVDYVTVDSCYREWTEAEATKLDA